VEKHVAAKNKNKSKNTSMKIRGIDYMPLLLGQAQIGVVTNAYRELVIKELHLRSINIDRKELIAKMKALLTSNKYPNPKNDQEKKFFYPKLLTASE
jgi:hypothetical protein